MSQKKISSSVCILVDFPRVAASRSSLSFLIHEQQFLDQCVRRAGFHPTDVVLEQLDCRSPAHPSELNKLTARLNANERLRVIIPFGSRATQYCTGKSPIDKWHTSCLENLPHLVCRKSVPTFHPERAFVEPTCKVFVELAFRRAREEVVFIEYRPPAEEFLLNPDFDRTMAELALLQKNGGELAVDIETGRGQINTVGFAKNAREAIAINTLPKRLCERKFKQLWESISGILEDENIGKILQNNGYESQVFSHYGIRLRGITWDTMWAQKFLWPELKMGLDNVGRIYTKRPYWKDDGKVSTANESGQKSWNNIRDWQRHYLYNCRDTTGTYEAYLAQKTDLESRNQLELFTSYIMKLADPIREMMSRGLPVNEKARAELEASCIKEIESLKCDLPEGFNPNSPKQKKAHFLGKGYKLYKTRNSKGQWAESVNEENLKKMRLKYPDDKDIQILLRVGKLAKKLGSYLSFKYDKDGVMRYSLFGVGTETGRFAGKMDCNHNGVNPQTLPKDIKKIFHAPEGTEFLEIDLQQAESRFVAYDCADATLIAMLEDPAKDIHKYVAAEIFQKLESEITYEERQLGKKAGHGANYDMGVSTFQGQCLKEMDLVLNKKDATNVLESYHRLFPGIQRWHQEIRSRLYRERRLDNPLGRVRHFYGRPGPDTYREAYAYRPQSTIPDITNHLMLGLLRERDHGRLTFGLHLQVHDSLLLSAKPEDINGILRYARQLDSWHPLIRLPGGVLRIPTSAARGACLGDLTDV